MNAPYRTPRAPDPFDAAAPVSLARAYLARHPDGDAAPALRGLLRYHEAIAEAAATPRVPYDRQLVAAMLRDPMRYQLAAISMQASLVAGCLHPDTPMEHPPLKRQHQDDGA